MFYENKIIEQEPIAPITREIAQNIHEKYRLWLSCTQVFKLWFLMEYCLSTREEIARLETLATGEMNGENQPTSKADLRNRLQSDLIDLDIFVQDYIDYVMVYEKDTKREDFAIQFIKPIEKPVETLPIE